METKELINLLEELVELPRETEWVEFKVSNYDLSRYWSGYLRFS
jgi:hypothetical protein